MAMFDPKLDYTQFIQFSPTGGLKIATFPEIRDALIKRYKEIYGNDIDTSSVSADGQFLNSVALIINNICSTFDFAFKQMNPNTATGKYLDILSSYNNLERKPATRSTVNIRIHNSTTNTIAGHNLYFMDKNNNIWTWICPINSDGQPTINFEADCDKTIEDVTCDTQGPIQASGADFDGWGKVCTADIYQFVNIESGLEMWQEENATVGRDEETDEELRSRRYQMLGMNSVSILDGLKSALLNIPGILDAVVVNNPEANPKALVEPGNDGTSVLSHSIYIALRYEEGVTIDDYRIAQIIYNKLTPGIGTTPYTEQGQPVSGVSMSYEFNIADSISYIINWKKCPSQKPIFELKYKANLNYDNPIVEGSIVKTSHEAISNTEKNIRDNLIKYINNVSINSYLQASQLLNVIQASDIQVAGQPTLFALSGNITDEINYPADLTYFKYEEDDIKFRYDETNSLWIVEYTGL